MHRTIRALSNRLTHLRAGEGPKVWWTFLYFFLLITAYYVIKPVSRSLILGESGVRLMPYGDLLSVVLVGPVVSLFAGLVDRLEKRRVVSLALWMAIAGLAAFWQLLQGPFRWGPVALYAWVSVLSVLVVTLFWLVANDLYHPRQGKRLFGFIGAGGILGGIAGSALAAAGAKAIGTPALLLLSAAILVACWLVVERLWRYAPGMGRVESRTDRPREPWLVQARAITQLLRRSRYLLLVAALVAIAKIVSTFVSYQFNPFIIEMFPDQDTKTAFLGVFFGWMNCGAFIIQFFCTSWVLRRLGPRWALLALPAGLIFGVTGLLALPVFWMASTTEWYDGSMNYSLQQTTKDMLYLPIDRTVRRTVKPFIEVEVFRFGKGIAALLGVLALDWWRLEPRVLGYLSVPLLAIWVALALQLRREHANTIRELLQTRATSRASRRWAAGFSQQKLQLIRQVFSPNGVLTQGGERFLDTAAEYEQRAASAEDDAASAADLKAWLSDPHQPMAKRRGAVTALVRRGGQDAADALLGALMVEEDAALRYELIRGLTKLRVRNRRLEFPQRLIRRQMAKEVQTCQHIARVAVVYRTSAGAVGKTDGVLQMLSLLMEEAVEQVFRLLGMIYRPEEIYLVYNQLREPDADVRADAIELLDHLVAPSVRWLIFPILDENQFLERVTGQPDEPVVEPEDRALLLAQSVWDHHRWLSLTVIGLVGQLRLKTLLPELERASTHPLPVIRLAAEAAHQMAAR